MMKMSDKNQVLLGNLIELKMSEFERRRRFVMTDEFYELSVKEQHQLLNENRILRKEIDSLKEEINKLSVENKVLKEELTDVRHDGELWLGDIIEKENPDFGENNLILSPVGSGKTYAITNILVPQGSKTQLLLVSTTSLKEALAADMVKSARKLEEDGITAFTTQSKSNYDENEYNLWIMTYAEFGSRIRQNENFILENEVSDIYSDEIHSLVEYIDFEDSHDLYIAMRYLLQNTPGVRKFYFTATSENLKKLYQSDSEWFADIKTFDYRNYPGVRKYTAVHEDTFGHVNQLRGMLDSYTGDFVTYGKKGLYFARRITELETFAEILEEHGLRPLVLWSKNNTTKQMTGEQLEALDELLKTERIPEGYDFLLINGALREGWNLKDDSVEVVIINSTIETDIIQARGRVRKNVSSFLVRETGAVLESKEDLSVPNAYLGKPLTTEVRRKMIIEMGMLNERGNPVGWRKAKSLLEDAGYTINEKRMSINKKQVRVTIIEK